MPRWGESRYGQESQALEDLVTELVKPRICSVPPCASSLGQQAVDFSRRHNAGLDAEQEFVLSKSVGLRADNKWAARSIGLNMPRQNGKGEIVMWRELFGLFELKENYIVHTAHEFKVSERHFERLEVKIRNTPELLAQIQRAPNNPNRIVGFRYSHGDEAIELRDGRRMEFKTRTAGGLRGFDDLALLVLDEAMILSASSHDTMLPTLRAATAEHGPQFWYMGSAADQMVHANSVVWARVRERGMAGDPDLAYFEWSLDYEHPDDVPEEVVRDPKFWREVNFGIERGRIFEEWMQFELESMGWRGFIVELLGVGDWPATDGSEDLLISLEQWMGLADTESELYDPVVVAFDISPNHRASIAAAGRNQRGEWHVEVINAREGTGWVVRRLEEMYEKHEIAHVVCDGYGPAAAIAKRIDEAGITVTRLKAEDYGKACGLFTDTVNEGTLHHIGQDELTAAIRGARSRPLVDRYAWSRTKSTVDISPLVASTLALYQAVEADVGGEVAIYF